MTAVIYVGYEFMNINFASSDTKNIFILVLILVTQKNHHGRIITSSTYLADQLNGSWSTRKQHPWLNVPQEDFDSQQQVGKPNGLLWV